jgi:hypothetical protein
MIWLSERANKGAAKENGNMMQVAGKIAALLGLSLALASCGSGSSNLFSTSALDLFSTSSKASGDTQAAGGSTSDIECPGISVRTGAATLMIGSKPGEEPSALDLRYQVTIIRTARECQVNSGIMRMKVGVEGRVITGPAGGPGTVNVPIRLAVVQEGVSPKTIMSRFASVDVVVASAVDRVPFVHVDPEISFPLPQPISNIDAYVVYVGFDPAGAQQERRKKPASKPKPRTAPGANPRQS